MKAKFKGKWYEVYPYSNGEDYLIKELGRAYSSDEFEAIQKVNSLPESRWFKYAQTKPPIGEEVLAFHEDWIDEDFNPKGTRVGFETDEGFVSAHWWDYHSTYVTISINKSEDIKDILSEKLANSINPQYWISLNSLIKILPIDKIKR